MNELRKLAQQYWGRARIKGLPTRHYCAGIEGWAIALPEANPPYELVIQRDAAGQLWWTLAVCCSNSDKLIEGLGRCATGAAAALESS